MHKMLYIHGGRSMDSVTNSVGHSVAFNADIDLTSNVNAVAATSMNSIVGNGRGFTSKQISKKF